MIKRYPLLTAITLALCLIQDVVVYAALNEDLIEAAFQGDVSKVRAFLSQGADVNANDKFGRRPLHLAAQGGRTEAAKFLIEKGADVSAKSSDGYTPLHHVSNTDVAKLLIEKGADVNAKGNDGFTPLHMVERTEVAKFLIEKGADVNAKDKDGRTPLRKAANFNMTDMAKLLIEKGADVNAKDKDGLTPFEAARLLGYSDFADLMRKHGGPSKRGEFNKLIKEISSRGYPSSTESERVIKLALSLIPPPAIPEEARRHMAEGIAALKIAKYVSGYKEAEKQFEKARTAAPWWADPYFNIGIIKEKTWKFYYGFDAERGYKAAVENLNLYLLAAPNAPDANAVQSKIYELEYLWKRRFEAVGHLNRGVDLSEAKRYEESTAEHKEAIRLDPEFGLAHYNLGNAYYYLKRHKESITESMEAIRLGYTELAVYISLGNSYYAIGDTKKAIDSLEEGLRVNRFGEYAYMAHNNLGLFYEKTSEYEKAIKHYEEAISLNHPRKTEIQNKIGNLKRLVGR